MSIRYALYIYHMKMTLAENEGETPQLIKGRKDEKQKY